MTGYAWRPQEGTQLKAITATWCEELFFGGARGGGKSDYLLGDYAQDISVYAQHWHGILFRKQLDELGELIKRSKEIFPPMGGIFKIQAKTWHFPNGATLKLRSLDRQDDAEKYQGHQYPWIGFDELSNWPTDTAWNLLKACNRSAHPIPFKRMRAGGNPGGVGHGWIKKRFIEPNPKGFTPITDVNYINIDTGVQIALKDVGDKIIKDTAWNRIESTRMFIPSKLQDNKILMKNDPYYIAKLAQSGGKQLVKAWLAGDWDAIEGAYFDTFSNEKHIIEPFLIPAAWTRIRGFDWGYSAPFCFLWVAVSDGSIVKIGGKDIVFPRDSMIVYREFYGTTGNPNEGIKMDAGQMSRESKEMQGYEKMNDQVADPAIFDVSTGTSIAEQMANEGVFWRPADNKRVPGWQQIRTRLMGIDDKPLIYFFNNCKNLIRTLPNMQYSKTKPEDLDTALEDHAVDTLRYICMSRPITVDVPKTLKEIGDQWVVDFNPHNVRAQIVNREKNNFE